MVTQTWPDGQPRRSGIVERGQPTGAWTYHDREGRIEARGSYMMGKPVGEWTWYHADGTPARSGSFTGGLRQGEWTRFHPGGVVAERGAYADDRQTGPWRWFHPDGRPAGEGAFVDGVRQGPWRQWDAQGRLVADGRYERGLRVGPWRDGPDRVEDLGPAPATVAAAVPVTATAPPPAIAPPAEPSIAQQRPPAEPLPSSPPVIPGFWTVAEERVASTILARAAGQAFDSNGYDAPPPPPRTVSPLIGTSLPRTRFLAADGAVVDVAALNREGRSVVLVLQRGFSGQICIYCAAQTAALADALPRFRARGAEVVVVFPGPSETIPAFIAAVQTLRTDPPPMPVCLDVDLGLVRGLRVEDAVAKPTALVVSPAGRITYAHVGRDKTDRPSVEELLDALPAGNAP
jgi:peroxiredoxin